MPAFSSALTSRQTVRTAHPRSRAASSTVTPWGRSMRCSSLHCLESWSPRAIGCAILVDQGLAGPGPERPGRGRDVFGEASVEVAHGAGRALDLPLAEGSGDVAPDLALVARVRAAFAQGGADACGLLRTRGGEERRVAGVEA